MAAKPHVYLNYFLSIYLEQTVTELNIKQNNRSYIHIIILCYELHVILYIIRIVPLMAITFIKFHTRIQFTIIKILFPVF